MSFKGLARLRLFDALDFFAMVFLLPFDLGPRSRSGRAIGGPEVRTRLGAIMCFKMWVMQEARAGPAGGGGRDLC